MILMLPAFAVNISAEIDMRTPIQKQENVSGSVFIDYIAEKIWIVTDRDKLNQELSDALLSMPENNIIVDSRTSDIVARAAKSENSERRNKTPQFMYAFKAVTDAQRDKWGEAKKDRYITALSKEKWFPIYGSGIDISKIIPNNAKKQYFIAIRETNDFFNNITGFDSRVGFPVSPRYNQKELSKSLVYDAVKEEIVLAQGRASIDAVYQFDLFPPITLSGMDNNNGIKVRADHFSLGATMSISSAPQVSDSGEVTFARSRIVKFKIPKQPNAPAVKVDSSGSNRRITGMKATFQFSFDFEDPYNTGAWVEKPGAVWTAYQGASTRNFNTESISHIFPGIALVYPEDEVYRVWVRIPPNLGKAPASKTVLLEIPAGWYID